MTSSSSVEEAVLALKPVEGNFQFQRPFYYKYKIDENDKESENIERRLAKPRSQQQNDPKKDVEIGIAPKEMDSLPEPELTTVTLAKSFARAAKTQCFFYAAGGASAVGVLAGAAAYFKTKKRMKVFDWFLYTSAPVFIATWVTCRTTSHKKMEELKERVKAANY